MIALIKSYLCDRKQFVSINEFNSNHAMLKQELPKTLYLGQSFS